MTFDSKTRDEKAIHPGLLGASVRRILLASAGYGFLMTPAFAQQAGLNANARDNDAGSGEIQEIVVTAEKSATPLSKTPIAVSAITQEQLTNAGVQSPSDLTVATPNVQIEVFPYTGALYVAIRGIVSKDWTETGDSDVGMYIDGVATPRAYGLDGAFYDLDRVEILRGPQGTLYGKDATAGNMNIITASPEQKFAAQADVGFGNYSDVSSHAMVNIPVTDTLAVRASAVFHKNDGFFDTEGTTTRNYGLIHEYGGRISALWQPSETFKWKVSIDDFISHNTEALAIATDANGQPIGGGSPYRRPAPSTPEPTQDINNFMARSRMDWEISKNLSFSYIAGVQTVDQTFATELPVSNALFAAPGEMASYATNQNKNQYHELNLKYEDSRFRNLFGVNYNTESTVSIYNNAIIPDSFNEVIDEPNAKDSGWGVFDQATFDVRDDLRLTAGVRESRDYKNVNQKFFAICPVNYFYPGGALPSSCTPGAWNGKNNWSAFTWKVGVDYDVTDKIMSYATVSTGYKAGGINQTSPGPSQDYRPEHNTNYEVGLKGRYLDGRATLSADFFYESYRDIDVNFWVFGSQGGTFLTENAARAAIYGPELEGSFLITSADRIDAFVNYLHATYTDYQNAKDPLTGITYDLTGSSLPNAPKGSARLQYSHEFSLPGGAGTLTPMAAVYYQTVSYLREFNLPDDRVPAYSKTSLRLTYASASDRWQLQGYVDNLENKAVRIGVENLIGAYDSWYATPRTYGATVKFKY